MRRHVSISKLMVGGKIIHVHHIDGVPVVLKKTHTCKREHVAYRPTHGCGWIDNIFGGVKQMLGSSVVVPAGLNRKSVSAGGSINDKQMTREQLLGAISSSMNKRRK